MNFYAPPLGGMVAPARPKKKKPSLVASEFQIQRAIQDAFRLKFQIALVHPDPGAGRVNGGGRFSALPAGYPDLVGIVPPTGRFLAIEVKAAGKVPTEAQVMMLDMMRAKGAIAFWADSVASALAQFEAAKGAAA